MKKKFAIKLVFILIFMFNINQEANISNASMVEYFSYYAPLKHAIVRSDTPEMNYDPWVFMI